VVAAWLDRVIPQRGTADGTLLAERGLVGHRLVPRGQQRSGHDIRRRPAPHTGQPLRGRWRRGGIAWRQVVPQRGRPDGRAQIGPEQPLAACVSATGERTQPEPGMVRSDRPAGRQRGRA
jgi:hypothetical protein